MRSIVYAAALTCALVLSSTMALSADEEPVAVNVNMARILRLNASAATVVIGNPGIADVTIQDPKTLILTGKSYGQTNMIVLDEAGEPIVDTILSVVQTHPELLTVYLGIDRTSMVCAPVCQQVIMIGDDTEYTGEVVASSTLVEGTAR